MTNRKRFSVWISTRSPIFGESLCAFLLTLENVNACLILNGENDNGSIHDQKACDLWLVDSAAINGGINQFATEIAAQVKAMQKDQPDCRIVLIANSWEEKRKLKRLDFGEVVMQGTLEEDLKNLCNKLENTQAAKCVEAN